MDVLSLGNDLYLFGGHDGSSYVNDLHKLSLETFQWSKVCPRHNETNWPMPKIGCRFAAIDKRRLCCFGGFAGRDKWTNEFHLYDVQEGTGYTNSLLYFVFVHVSSLSSYRLLIHTSLVLYGQKYLNHTILW